MSNCQETERNNSSRDSGILSIALFSFILASTMTLAYFIGRIGFQATSSIYLGKSLLLSLYLLLLPPVIKMSLQNSCLSLPGSVSVISIINFLAIICLGISVPYLPFNPAILIYIVGGILVGFLIRNCFRAYNKPLDILSIAVMLLLSIWIVCKALGLNYTGPLFLEKILIGTAKADTMFHSAVSGMIKTYGIPSTGVDGLIPVHYHVGSHWILAQLAKLLEVEAIDAYNGPFHIIFLPLLANSILMFALDIRQHIALSRVQASPDVKSMAGHLDVLFWVMVLVTHVGLAPCGYQSWDSHLISESYALALAMTFIFLSTALRISYSIKTRPLTLLSVRNFFYLSFLLSMFISIAFIKISLGFLLFSIMGYLAFRTRYRIVVLCTAIVAIGGVLILGRFTSLIPSSFMTQLQIDPFYHFLTYWQPGPKLVYFSVEYFWSMLFIIIKLWEYRLKTIARLRNAITNRTILDVEVIIVACLVGAAPGIFFHIVGGGAYYFTDFQRWLAISLLLANVDTIRSMLSNRLSKPLCSRGASWGVRSIWIAFLMVVLVIGWQIMTNVKIAVTSVLQMELATRSKLREAAGIVTVKGDKGRIFTDLLLRKDLGGLWMFGVSEVMIDQTAARSLKGYEMLEVLRKLGEMSRSQKRESALYIPQCNAIFWQLLKDCRYVPFIAPAISGIALIDGMPRHDCDISEHGGYAGYEPRNHDQLVNECANFERACVRAMAKGFSRIIVINASEDGKVFSQEVHCASQPPFVGQGSSIYQSRQRLSFKDGLPTN